MKAKVYTIIAFLMVCILVGVNGKSVVKADEEKPSGESEAPVIELEHKDDYTSLTYNNIDTIKVVQNALNEHDFSCGTVDGVAGNATKEAIKRFQESCSLEPTGVINDELIDALGCWDQADLRLSFNFCDMNGNPVDSFSKSDRVFLFLIGKDFGRANDIQYTLKTTGPDGSVYYNEMSPGYDEEGNPMLSGFVYFNNPNTAMGGNMKCEVTDENNNLLVTAHVKAV